MDVVHPGQHQWQSVAAGALLQIRSDPGTLNYQALNKTAAPTQGNCTKIPPFPHLQWCAKIPPYNIGLQTFRMVNIPPYSHWLLGWSKISKSHHINLSEIPNLTLLILPSFNILEKHEMILEISLIYPWILSLQFCCNSNFYNISLFFFFNFVAFHLKQIRTVIIEQTVKMATGIQQMRNQSHESSILFMQQEHAATLKGLHEEIQKLQKRCSGKSKERHWLEAKRPHKL